MDLPTPVILIVGLAMLTLLAIIVAPSRRVRAERRLPSDVQARVLLGEHPDEIDAAASSRREPSPESIPPTAS